MNFYSHVKKAHSKVLLLVVLLKVHLFCMVLANQGIRATGFMCAQGMSNAQNRCTFKSTTNKSTFEYAFLIFNTFVKVRLHKLSNQISNSKDQFSFSHIEMITTQEHQDIIKKVIDPRVAFSLHNKQEKFSPPGDKIPSVTLIMSAASKVR